MLVPGARAEPDLDSAPLGSVAAAAVTLSPCALVLVPAAAAQSAVRLGDGVLLVARAEDPQTLAAAAALARALDSDLRIAGSRHVGGRRAALIIGGPHRPGPRRRDALDPLTRSILREATVPVMILPAHLAAPAQRTMATGEDWRVAANGSPFADRRTRAPLGAMVWVVDPKGGTDGATSEPGSMSARWRARAARAKWASRRFGGGYSGQVVEDAHRARPANVVSVCAGERGARPPRAVRRHCAMGSAPQRQAW